MKAYVGALPDGMRGVEFTTPAQGEFINVQHSEVSWRPSNPGVPVNSQGYAVIRATITKNTQIMP